jgi:4-hydroxyproline epimerase
MILEAIDSHTEGEPTRVVVTGGPDLGSGTLMERRERFRNEYDRYRSAIVNEPRGSDAVVGALLCAPEDKRCAAGVIFFNNVGYLSMCGHGTIGLVTTLAYLGRIRPGRHKIETPAGIVTAELHEDSDVTIRNVASYRHAKAVELEVEGFGRVTGDVAWGGNWFFLARQSPVDLELKNLDVLIKYTWTIRKALGREGITGASGQEIDHIEVFGPPRRSDAQSRNFVLCPGKAYDRSPCGTGTSAKLACLYEDKKLREGEIWRQESIVGGLFEGQVEVHGGNVYPLIRGRAYVNAEVKLVLDARDPFCWGIRA